MRLLTNERTPRSLRAQVQRQIRLGRPPELRAAYLRLRAIGTSHQRALRWIVGALRLEASPRGEGPIRRRDLYRRLLRRAMMDG